MNDVKKRIDAVVSDIKQERDELQVKLQLAKLDAGDEWEKLEAQLAKLEAKARELGSATADASQNIGAEIPVRQLPATDGAGAGDRVPGHIISSDSVRRMIQAYLGPGFLP